MEAPAHHVMSGISPDSVYIGSFHRDGCIGPDAFARLAWDPADGLEITMWSYDPFPVCRCTDADSGFGEDSLLACCIDLFPRYRYKGYISIETNANGICRCTFGPNGVDRETFAGIGLPQPEAEITRPIRDGGRCWMSRVRIPADSIRILYDLPVSFRHGHQIRANFYAIRESASAHYWGSWKPCRPMLHASESFGFLEIL